MLTIRPRCRSAAGGMSGQRGSRPPTIVHLPIATNLAVNHQLSKRRKYSRRVAEIDTLDTITSAIAQNGSDVISKMFMAVGAAATLSNATSKQNAASVPTSAVQARQEAEQEAGDALLMLDTVMAELREVNCELRVVRTDLRAAQNAVNLRRQFVWFMMEWTEAQRSSKQDSLSVLDTLQCTLTKVDDRVNKLQQEHDAKVHLAKDLKRRCTSIILRVKLGESFDNLRKIFS